MGKLCFYYFPTQNILTDYGLDAGWKKSLHDKTGWSVGNYLPCLHYLHIDC